MPKHALLGFERAPVCGDKARRMGKAHSWGVSAGRRVRKSVITRVPWLRAHACLWGRGEAQVQGVKGRALGQCTKLGRRGKGSGGKAQCPNTRFLALSARLFAGAGRKGRAQGQGASSGLKGEEEGSGFRVRHTIKAQVVVCGEGTAAST